MLCVCGSKAIGAVIGESPREVGRLVAEQGLPAWKREGRGAWRALPSDLELWLQGQRDRYLGVIPDDYDD
ncbi:MAG: DNA-binding protein [Desulfovibrio aminophilus]|jgi:hypothetical protein|uniref:hypothetical protein n=1 Tax=Desulfovibrio aminophilus TaxID=81425 RepID=UPI0004091063|nr:hypothetical protein [Desulfovibrio aminophilus]MDY0306363.1 DNA-binding protein [Desulfovibrionaceae bacterium]